MLWKLAKKCRGEEGDAKAEDLGRRTTDDEFQPAKLFSIDRVFRNETMDATHLAEFHQVEGVVADRNLTLADLIGETSARVINAVDLTICRFHEGILQEDGYRESEI
jgi:phenylalanyl-tRNA synthetase alpha subunit